MSRSALEIIDLHKRFGGVAANDGINLTLELGEIHALIGPNGSGKTTLIDQILGELTPDRGLIKAFGQNLTKLPIHARSQLGIARSWQVPSLFSELTAAENVAYGLRAAQGLSPRIWSKAMTPELSDQATNLLSEAGLGHKSHTTARDLSHGDQRKLDVAIALSTSPSVVLLDEPLAGLGAEEITHMVALIRKTRANSTTGQKRTVVLVEHDMDAVFSLSDRISVMDEGKILATDTPDNIRNNPAVLEAYLGNA
jgi:branched-chain amino acid transport system ATP-binding protein